MAFNGKLIELKTGANWVELPMKYMKAESYKASPNQRMESKAGRATTGLLHRTTCTHTATKVEFNTPPMTNKDIATLNALFSAAFTNSLRRDITIRYYDNETDSYKTANCYMPDVDYNILRVDLDRTYIQYDAIRYAFIEY